MYLCSLYFGYRGLFGFTMSLLRGTESASYLSAYQCAVSNTLTWEFGIVRTVGLYNKTVRAYDSD